jgi:uncharacterized membrane protein YesL
MKSRLAKVREDNDDLFAQIDKWVSLMMMNLLWVVFALPLITLPAGTAALFTVLSLRVRGKQPELFQEFFGALRRHWLTATLLGLANLLLVGLLLVNVSIFPIMSLSDPLAFLSRTVTLFVGLALSMVNLYAWTLLPVLDVPVKQLVIASARLAFAYPLWSFAILAAAVLPILISLLLPQAVFVFFTFACSAWIVTVGTWRIIRRHLPEDELLTLEARQP